MDSAVTLNLDLGLSKIYEYKFIIVNEEKSLQITKGKRVSIYENDFLGGMWSKSPRVKEILVSLKLRKSLGEM